VKIISHIESTINRNAFPSSCEEGIKVWCFTAVSQFCAMITKNLYRAMHDFIFRPPVVLTDTIECQEGIPDITDMKCTLLYSRSADFGYKLIIIFYRFASFHFCMSFYKLFQPLYDLLCYFLPKSII
jgi:hypothetical protein